MTRRERQDREALRLYDEIRTHRDEICRLNARLTVLRYRPVNLCMTPTDCPPRTDIPIRYQRRI